MGKRILEKREDNLMKYILMENNFNDFKLIENEVFDTFEEANIERIFLQSDYDYLLEVVELQEII